jgi:HAD superfamily hydrolase (TIGR01549 family)
MANYSCFLFDLYGTLLDDTHGLAEREQYRLDNIYTILEKSMYPVKFADLQKKYGEMNVHVSEVQDTQKKAFTPFSQVAYLLHLLKVNDLVVFKKVYDSYVDAILQITPKLAKNAERALQLLKEKNKKTGIISNTGKTPGHVVRLLLKELNILDYFDDFVFSDEAGFLKPDPIVFDIAVKKMGVVRKDAIYIGDNKISDYDGAIKAGLAAHLFRRDDDDLYDLAVQFSDS